MNPAVTPAGHQGQYAPGGGTMAGMNTPEPQWAIVSTQSELDALLTDPRVHLHTTVREDALLNGAIVLEYCFDHDCNYLDTTTRPGRREAGGGRPHLGDRQALYQLFLKSHLRYPFCQADLRPAGCSPSH